MLMISVLIQTDVCLMSVVNIVVDLSKLSQFIWKPNSRQLSYTRRSRRVVHADSESVSVFLSVHLSVCIHHVTKPSVVTELLQVIKCLQVMLYSHFLIVLCSIDDGVVANSHTSS